MPGGKRGGFVDEEEDGVLAGLHEGTSAAAELECAGDPGFCCVSTNDPAVLVVEATTIAHEGAAGGGGDDLAGRGDAVLKGHMSVWNGAHSGAEYNGRRLEVCSGVSTIRPYGICVDVVGSL